MIGEFGQVLRTLRRSPGFVLLAIGLLGFGIGAAAVVFSVFDALMLRPLPVADPQNLVRLVTIRPQLGPRSYFRPEVFETLQRESRTFSSVGATYEINAGYTDAGQTERVLLGITSSSFFTTFGVGAWAGRVLEPSDDQGQSGIFPAILSYQFWQRHYQSRRNVLGRQIIIRGQPFQIAGILPEGFNGATIESGPDVRVPLPSVKLFFRRKRIGSSFSLNWSQDWPLGSLLRLLERRPTRSTQPPRTKQQNARLRPMNLH